MWTDGIGGPRLTSALPTLMVENCSLILSVGQEKHTSTTRASIFHSTI